MLSIQETNSKAELVGAWHWTYDSGAQSTVLKTTRPYCVPPYWRDRAEMEVDIRTDKSFSKQISCEKDQTHLHRHQNQFLLGGLRWNISRKKKNKTEAKQAWMKVDNKNWQRRCI